MAGGRPGLRWGAGPWCAPRGGKARANPAASGTTARSQPRSDSFASIPPRSCCLRQRGVSSSALRDAAGTRGEEGTGGDNLRPPRAGRLGATRVPRTKDSEKGQGGRGQSPWWEPGRNLGQEGVIAVAWTLSGQQFWVAAGGL